MLKRLLLILALLLPSALSAQSRWWSIYADTTQPGARFYDQATLVDSGNYVTGFIRVKSQFTSDTTVDGKPYASTTYQMTADCKRKLERMDAAFYYNTAGVNIDSFQAIQSLNPLKRPVPESVGETDMRALCLMARQQKLKKRR